MKSIFENLLDITHPKLWLVTAVISVVLALMMQDMHFNTNGLICIGVASILELIRERDGTE